MVSKRRSLGSRGAMLGLALVAMLAFGALSAAAASAVEAPQWKVKGALLGAGVTKSFTATNTTEVRLGNASRNLVITAEPGQCTESGEIEGSAEGSPAVKKNVVLTCKNLKTFILGVDRTTLCPVNSVGAEARTIKTNTLKSTVVWKNGVGGAAGDLLAPASGTDLASIEIKGATCPLATGATPLKLTNGLIDSILPVEEEAETGTLSFPESPILSYWSNAESRSKTTIEQLKLGGTVATFKGDFSISLSPKEKFGVFPVEKSFGKAPRWKVNGAYLHDGQTEAFTALSTGPMSLIETNWTIDLGECTETGLLKGSKEGTPASMTEVKLTCKGVKFINNPSCKFRTPGQAWGTMASYALNGALQNMSGKLEMTSPNEAIWFYMETSECFLGTGAIKGAVVGEMQTLKTATTLPSTFNSGGLAYGSYPLAFAGSFNTSLVSGKSFGIYEG